VWASEEGAYELLDGFKRLERWRGAGAARVPVVIESLSNPLDAKTALLAANAPRRTLSILDEARVVASLRHDDGLGPKTIAH
jgi:ParB-like chromosome segregation protein Spo0J